jgi:hypothetical protein
MAEKIKRLVWVIILITTSSLAFNLADRDIFPRQDVEKKVPVQGYSREYLIKKTVSEPNPKDAVVKLGLVAVIAVAYWTVLGFVIQGYGTRLVVFLVSIPAAYAVLVYAAFATQFG